MFLKHARLFLINDMYTLSAPPPLLLKSGQIGFLVQKNAQCSETNEKTILRFSVYEIWLILYSKFLENWPKCHHKCKNYWVLLQFRLRLAKCVSEDSKIRFFNVFYEFFYVKIVWNVCKKCLSKSKQKKKYMLGERSPPKTPWLMGGLAHHTIHRNQLAFLN